MKSLVANANTQAWLQTKDSKGGNIKHCKATEKVKALNKNILMY
jgi:hypothetical protein